MIHTPAEMDAALGWLLICSFVTWCFVLLVLCILWIRVTNLENRDKLK